VPELEQEILECAEAGVAGYVTRNGSLADLIATIESVGRDEIIVSPRVAAALVRRLALLAAERRGPSARRALTSRERDVVMLLEGGLSNKEIAERLCIEVTTVKHHVHNILKKLRVSRRGEAAAKLRGAA
jgi:two-component system nitrate/nitrite response regulator NarL